MLTRPPAGDADRPGRGKPGGPRWTLAGIPGVLAIGLLLWAAIAVGLYFAFQ